MAESLGEAVLDLRADVGHLRRDLARAQALSARHTRDIRRNMREMSRDSKKHYDTMALHMRQMTLALADTDRATKKTKTGFTQLGDGIQTANSRILFFRNIMRLISFPAVITALGFMVQAFSALTAGVTALTSALAPLSGALVALPGLYGAIGQAAGVIALTGINDLTEALGGNEEALKRLTPAGKKFLNTLKGYGDQFGKLKEKTQGTLFGGATVGIEKAMKNFGSLRKVIGDTTGVMSDLAKHAGRFLGREGFGRDFEKIGKGNANILRQLGQAGFHFADALRHVMVAAQPFLKWMFESVKQFSMLIEAEAKAGRESGRMADFFEQTRNVMERLVSIGQSMGAAFSQIGQAAAPLGRAILKAFDESAQGLEKWSESLGGQQSLATFFDDAKVPIFEVGRLLAAAGKEFLKIGTEPGFANLVRQIRKELLPVISDVISQLTKAFGPKFVDLLVELGKTFGHFTDATGPLTLFVEALRNVLHIFNKLAEISPIVEDALTTAIGGIAIARIFGGKQKVGTAGQRLGKLLGRGIIIGLLLALPSILEDVFHWSRRNRFKIRQVGADWGEALVNEMIKAINLGIRAINKIMDETNVFGKLGVDAPNIGEVGRVEFIGPIEAKTEQLNDRIKRINQNIDKGSESWDKWAKSFGISAKKVDKGLKDHRGALSRNEKAYKKLTQVAGGKMAQITGITKKEMRRMQREMAKGSAAGREAIGDNFDKAINRIEKAMKTGKISVQKGGRLIEKLLHNQLKMFGVKDPAGYIAKQGITKGGRGVRTPTEQGATTRQFGGPVNASAGFEIPGMGSGDKVPVSVGGVPVAMTEPTEKLFVLNRTASSVLDRLQRFNSLVPRQATGGIVEAGKMMQSMGLHVGEHPAFGGVGGVHVSGSRHYTNEAVNASGSMPLMHKAFDRVAKGWFGHGLDELFLDTEPRHVDAGNWVSGPIGGHIDHLHAAIIGAFAGGARGTGGPRKIELPRFFSDYVAGGAVAEGLNRLAEAGEAIQPPGSGPHLMGGAGGPYNKRELMGLWQQAGGRSAASNVAAAIALAESAGDPTAVSSAGARGLWQIMPFHGGGDKLFDPLFNAGKAIDISSNGRDWGAWDVAGRAGQPVTFTQFLAEGGLVPQKLAAGSLIKAIQKVTSGRREDKLRDRIKNLGLPPAAENQMGFADIFREYADTAAALTTDTAQGKFGGITEAQWLVKELEILLWTRNRLLELKEMLEKRKKTIEKAVKAAHKELRELKKKKIDKKIEQLKKQPGKKRGETDKQYQKRVTAWKQDKDRLKHIKDLQKGQKRLKVLPRIIDHLETSRDDVSTSIPDYLSAIDDVQGPYRPMHIMKRLPPMGELGGRILSAQLRLRDLGTEASVSDTTTAQLELTQQQLQEARQRNLVLERQYPVFSDFAHFAGLPQFHSGGIPTGTQEVLSKLLPGEGVVDSDTMEKGITAGNNYFAIDPMEGRVRAVSREEYNSMAGKKISLARRSASKR